MNLAARIQLGFVAFLLVAGSTFVLPRFAAGNQTGFAASTTAALTLLGLAALAGVIGVVLLVSTLRSRASLSAGTRLAGFLPLPLLAIGVLVLVGLARSKYEQQQSSEPPPRTLTPTAPVTAP